MSALSATPPLILSLFGRFEALRGETPLSSLHLRDGERLLAYLALHTGEAVASQEIVKLFWPSEAQRDPGEQGNYPSLRQALFILRQALGPDAFRLTRPHRAAVMLNLEGVETDVLIFDKLARQEGDEAAKAWEEAVTRYRGPLLEGWTEPWAIAARRSRKREYERALRRLTQTALQAGNVPQAENWLRKLRSSRPDDEEAARDLLRLLTASGRHAEAKEVIEKLADIVNAAGRTLDAETMTLIGELKALREREILPPSARTRPVPPPPAPAPRTPDALESAPFLLEPAGGAIPIDSPFYIVRDADHDLHTALTRGDSIICVKGARQVGKTSLLARGLQQVREVGKRVVLTDFQKINEAQFASPDTLFLALANAIALQLELDVSPKQLWDPDCGPNMNLELFLRRHVLRAFPEPLIWCMDEVDRLFAYPFGSEAFGLFRSWHNERALAPDGPWSRLTLTLAYATEAHLFISDLNQSPFNVGTRLALEDFTIDDLAELNRRYGSPLADAELPRFHALVGGQPYLARRGLDEAARGVPFDRIEAEGANDGGLFDDHLHRLYLALSHAPELLEVLRDLLAGRPCAEPENFYRLRTAGILSGVSSQAARFRCGLYETYLGRRA